MIYNRINHFLPTYKRVNNGKLPRYINSVINCMSNPDLNCITLLVNKDDRETLSYTDSLPSQPECAVLLWDETEKPSLSKMYNYIYNNTPFNDPFTMVSMVGDDMEWRTKDFDSQILYQCNHFKGAGIIYCNDDFVQGNKLAVNFFTTRDFVAKTKHPFMCELFDSYFIDTVWDKFTRAIKKRYYLQHIILKHHHYTGDIKNIDDTSKRLKSVQISFAKANKLIDAYVNEILISYRGRPL
jgi:hypothetical protein